MQQVTEEQIEEQKRLCMELPMIEQRLFRCGLLRTAHAMNTAVQRIGYERAQYVEAAQKFERARAKFD